RSSNPARFSSVTELYQTTSNSNFVSRRRCTSGYQVTLGGSSFVVAPAALSKRRAHMRGDGSDDVDRRAIFVKRHDHFPRMQMQHWSNVARCGPINRVAEDGPTHRGALDAKPMRASGQRLGREPGQIPSPQPGPRLRAPECKLAGGGQEGRSQDGARYCGPRLIYRAPPLTPPGKGEGNDFAPSPSILSLTAVRRDRVSSTSRGRHRAAPAAARSVLHPHPGRLRPPPNRF